MVLRALIVFAVCAMALAVVVAFSVLKCVFLPAGDPEQRVGSISRPWLDPDSTQFVYGYPTERVQYIGDFGYGEELDGRVEVYVYDLRTRQQPRLVFSKAALGVEMQSVRCIWLQDGIHVGFSTGEGAQYYHLRPDGKGLREVSADAGRLIFRRAEEQHLRDQRLIVDSQGFLVEESHGQFFGWNPETHAKELLFELPLALKGSKVAREHQRRMDSLHRIGSVHGALAGDSLHLTIHTYAPRPDSTRRPYRVQYDYDLVCGAAGEAYPDRRRGRLVGDLVLGPAPAVSFQSLGLPRGEGTGVRFGGVKTHLLKVPESADSLHGLATRMSSEVNGRIDVR